MALFSVAHVQIAGISACVPQNTYKNDSYRWISEKKRQSLIENTGISQRRTVAKGTTASDLCIEAAQKLISALKWELNDISLLVFVSSSPDYDAPATACLIQDRLGLSDDCMAFDINMACSGYPYGLSVVSKMLSKDNQRALLLVGDTGSLHTSYKDKSAFPLFGDAGTATALQYNPISAEIFFNLQTSGKGYKALYVPDGGSRNPISKSSIVLKKYGEGIYRKRNQIFLDGVEILKFSLSRVPSNIRKTLEFANLEMDMVDYFVLHQANKMINNNIGKILKINPDKMPETLYHYGNTISASIPLTIVKSLGEILNQNSKTLLLCGFGAGLSFGSAVFKTKDMMCLPLIEK
ncbi:MAG: ketoacyl-ACP synthase III [Bacteroidales bacterium]|nr:ketoacyl-ACP synthase III [Bacteroidales bacterium]